MLDDFKQACDAAEIVMFTTFCAIHPNFLYEECGGIVKVLAAIDDPPASFERTVPYLFAVDLCTHVSLSYNDRTRMADQLKIWGAKKTYFTPIGASHLNRKENLRDEDLKNREIDLLYVGGMYPTKIDRFTCLKREFGDRFRLYGRWSPYGLRGLIYTLLHPGTHELFRWRVRSLTPAELPRYYQRTKIGINMHWGNAETGNSRLYELPANGVMQICDRGAGNATAELFEEGREIVLYDDMEEAIDKIRYYLAHPDEREKIALAGYRRVMRDYRQETIYRGLFDWIVREFGL
jgi:spore maturation protein CgeB